MAENAVSGRSAEPRLACLIGMGADPRADQASLPEEVSIMPINSAAELIALLRQLQLVKPAQLDDLTCKIDGEQLDARTVAQKLIEAGWLTPYQANQLLQGRGTALLLGSYVILERLGEGGMGEVFKAKHRHLDRTVALKLIHRERVDNPQAVRRFRREIEVAAKLNHPNIVLAYDADQIDNKHFFTMEFVEGTDLNKIVKEKGPLPVEQACDYIRQTAVGLQHAHERGLVHRDIKPHNLLLSKTGTVKILDMGLARMQADDDSSTLTKEGSVMGTLDYVSPEQAMNAHTVDIRADLYSLGCTFYFLLTGRVPFPGGTAMEKLSNHAFHEPTPVGQLRPDVPPGVAAVVLKLMAKKPEERFQTPAEVAAVLAKGAQVPAGAIQAAPRSAAVASTLPPIVALALPVEADEMIAAGTTPPEAGLGGRKRQRVLLLAGGAGLLGLCILSLAFFMRSGGDQSSKANLTTSTRPKPLDDMLENKIGMKLKLIPKGSFTMGSSPQEIDRLINLKLGWPPPEFFRAEGPQHEVEISQPFYMGLHTVTRGQFRQFLKNSPYRMPKGAHRHFPPNGEWKLDGNADWENPSFDQDDTHPVVCVSWNDAKEFIKWLNDKHPLVPRSGKAGEWKYALPTEAEWEYACRANTRTRYWCGDDDGSLQGAANLADLSYKKAYISDGVVGWDDGFTYTAPVGKFKPNPWGLYDMHGNVWQWCADAYDANFYNSSPKMVDPMKSAGGNRVARGGSWLYAPSRCRSAFRNQSAPGTRSCHIGFRVVLVRVVPGRIAITARCRVCTVQHGRHDRHPRGRWAASLRTAGPVSLQTPEPAGAVLASLGAVVTGIGCWRRRRPGDRSSVKVTCPLSAGPLSG